MIKVDFDELRMRMHGKALKKAVAYYKKKFSRPKTIS